MRVTSQSLARPAILCAALFLAAAVLPQGSMAQGGKWRSVSGKATAASVNVGATNQQFSSDTLPSGGGQTTADFMGASVPSFLTTSSASAVSAGAADGTAGNAQSVATAADVNIMNGLITASRVIGIASAVAGSGAVAADGDGSVITDLVINGTSYGSGDVTPAPNTRVDLPGVGYVLLNEQVRGKGVGPGLTVNMIHVVLTGARTGDIIVGSATSASGR